MAGYDNTFLFFNDALGEPNPQMTDENHSLLAEALKRVSLLISAGNVLVFDELAWPFANLINTFSRDWDYDEKKLYTFLQAHFQPGPLEQGGQHYLREAFTAYYKARFETNEKQGFGNAQHRCPTTGKSDCPGRNYSSLSDRWRWWH